MDDDVMVQSNPMNPDDEDNESVPTDNDDVCEECGKNPCECDKETCEVCGCDPCVCDEIAAVEDVPIEEEKVAKVSESMGEEPEEDDDEEEESYGYGDDDEDEDDEDLM